MFFFPPTDKKDERTILTTDITTTKQTVDVNIMRQAETKIACGEKTQNAAWPWSLFNSNNYWRAACFRGLASFFVNNQRFTSTAQYASFLRGKCLH